MPTTAFGDLFPVVASADSVCRQAKAALHAFQGGFGPGTEHAVQRAGGVTQGVQGVLQHQHIRCCGCRGVP